MPRINWCKPVPPPKYIGDLFKRRRSALGITREELGALVMLSPGIISKRLNQPDEDWDIKSIVDFGRALRLDPDEVEETVFLALRRGMKTGKWWMNYDKQKKTE